METEQPLVWCRATALWLNGAPQWVLNRLQETSGPQGGAPYGGGQEPTYTDLF